MQAIKDYENNKWKVIGQKVGKPAKVRTLFPFSFFPLSLGFCTGHYRITSHHIAVSVVLRLSRNTSTVSRRSHLRLVMHLNSHGFGA